MLKWLLNSKQQFPLWTDEEPVLVPPDTRPSASLGQLRRADEQGLDEVSGVSEPGLGVSENGTALARGLTGSGGVGRENGPGVTARQRRPEGLPIGDVEIGEQGT